MQVILNILKTTAVSSLQLCWIPLKLLQAEVTPLLKESFPELQIVYYPKIGLLALCHEHM